MVYFRHYCRGDVIEVEYIKIGYLTYVEGNRKFSSILDLIFMIITLLLFLDKLNNTVSLIIFVIWFIVTDIVRQRYSKYETYISRWLYVSKIEINNNKWELHKGDKDPYPSVPHMHSKILPLKMDIYTGEIFNSNTGKLISIVKKKELKKLWSDKKFVEVVMEARTVFLNNNPKFILPKYDHLIDDLKN